MTSAPANKFFHLGETVLAGALGVVPPGVPPPAEEVPRRAFREKVKKLFGRGTRRSTQQVRQKILFCVLVLCALQGTGRTLRACAAPLHQLTIGVPDWEKDLRYLESRSPAAMLVRNFTLEGITGPGDEQPELWMIDRVERGATNAEWKLRVREEVQFHSSEPVTGRDLLAVIKKCPAAQQVVDSVSVGREAAEDTQRLHEFLTVRLRGTSPGFALLTQVLRNCPVRPERAHAVFGDSWGTGTNLVGTGPYRIHDFVPGTSLSFVRAVWARDSLGGADAVTIRGFQSDEQGLTALRLGNVEALLLRGREGALQASKEPLLTVRQCPIGTVVFRASDRLACRPFFAEKFSVRGARPAHPGH